MSPRICVFGEAELVCNNSTSEQQRCLGAGSGLVGFEVSCDGPNGPFAHFSSWMIDLSATVDSSGGFAFFP